jgi:hypothetical protein
MLKWVLSLQELKFKITHRSGAKHGNADAISRCPLKVWSKCPYGGGLQEPLYGEAPPFIVGVAARSTTKATAYAAVSGGTRSKSRASQAQAPDRNYELLREDKETVAMQDESDDCDGGDHHGAQQQDQPEPPAASAPSTSRTRLRSVRIPDSDVDDASNSEEDEDPTLAQSVRPPAYFPPVDLEAWDAQELHRLQMAIAFCFEKMKPFTLPGSTAVWGEHRSNLPLSKQARPSNAASELVMNSGAVLCHRSKNGIPCIVVPKSLKAFVLRRHHGIPISGHLGRRRVILAIRERYWWKGMHRDVNHWVRACLVCRRRKTPRPLHAGQARSNPLAPHPWHTASIDLVGPLNTTVAGDKDLLTILDTFTRWIIAVPIRSKEAHVIADALYYHLLTKHGCPSVIYSDQGTEFVNLGLKTMCKTWGIRKLETSGWEPQANPVERVHRWLNHALTTLRQKFGGEWNNYVDVVVFSYNTSVHDTTGYAPFKLLYGRHPTLPDDLLFGIPAESAFEVEADYAIHCSRQQAVAYKALIQNQTAMATHNRLCRETHQQDVAFNPGEQVL